MTKLLWSLCPIKEAFIRYALQKIITHYVIVKMANATRRRDIWFTVRGKRHDWLLKIGLL